MLHFWVHSPRLWACNCGSFRLLVHIAAQWASGSLSVAPMAVHQGQICPLESFFLFVWRVAHICSWVAISSLILPIEFHKAGVNVTFYEFWVLCHLKKNFSGTRAYNLSHIFFQCFRVLYFIITTCGMYFCASFKDDKNWIDQCIVT